MFIKKSSLRFRIIDEKLKQYFLINEVVVVENDYYTDNLGDKVDTL